MIQIIIIMFMGLVGIVSCFMYNLREIDSNLNYSMKKKIVTKKIPLYFPNDRINESMYGPTLEYPNEGTYLPAFVLSILTYIIGFAYIVTVIVCAICLTETLVFKVAAYGLLVIGAWEILLIVIGKTYEHKYFKNRDANIKKISQILNGNREEK